MSAQLRDANARDERQLYGRAIGQLAERFGDEIYTDEGARTSSRVYSDWFRGALQVTAGTFGRELAAVLEDIAHDVATPRLAGAL